MYYASYVVTLSVNLKQVERARIWENSVSKYQYQLGIIEGFDLGICIVSPPVKIYTDSEEFLSELYKCKKQTL